MVKVAGTMIKHRLGLLVEDKHAISRQSGEIMGI
jgi:hypothetical protein